MRRNRLMRWLVVVAVVLAVHVAIFAGLMQRRSALPVPQPNGIEVRTETPSTAAGQAGTDAKNPAAESINTASSTKPVSSSSSQTMIKNTDTHMQEQTNSVANATPSGIYSLSPAENKGERHNGVATSSGAGLSENVGESAAGSSDVSGGLSVGALAGTGSATGTGTVDCSATLKPANATVVGLDVAVWVERLAGGVRFVGLVNQAGEGNRYLREIRSAVAGVRFVSHDAQCVGQKVKVKVRITS